MAPALLSESPDPAAASDPESNAKNSLDHARFFSALSQGKSPCRPHSARRHCGRLAKCIANPKSAAYLSENPGGISHAIGFVEMLP
jgi:hypothetical protein